MEHLLRVEDTFQVSGRGLVAVPELPLPELFAVVHRALRGTRGAAASAASFDATSQCFEFAGIGNVAPRVLTESQPTTARATWASRSPS